MIFIRTLLFNIVFFSFSFVMSILLLPLLVLPRRKLYKTLNTLYFRIVKHFEYVLIGLKYKIEGLENLPKEGGYIVASKHQSAYETLKYPILLDEAAIIMKKELMQIPFWGWYPARAGHIGVDRGTRERAVKSITEGAKRVLLDEKRPLLIFPEGTRTKPGQKDVRYKRGISHIYEAVNVPVVPIALNSGAFWGKNSFWKRPGTVTFRILPPIPPGLTDDEFRARLKAAIEDNSTELLKDVGFNV